MDKPTLAAPKGHSGPLPWVKLRSAASGHQLYKRMLDVVDPRARPGDAVTTQEGHGHDRIGV